MTTTPEQPTTTDVLDAGTARQALTEMAAVVRTIFGVNLHNTEAPAQQHQEPAAYEDIPPSFDPAPEQDLTVPQTAALTSVPAPAVAPVPGVAATVITPELATSVVAPSGARDVSPPMQPAAPSSAAAIPVPTIAVPGVQGPGIAVPGLDVPAADPSAELLHGDQQFVDHQYVDGPTEQANEAGEDDQDEAPLPPEYATIPDRHSMALLHEIAFLDD